MTGASLGLRRGEAAVLCRGLRRGEAAVLCRELRRGMGTGVPEVSTPAPGVEGGEDGEDGGGCDAVIEGGGGGGGGGGGLGPKGGKECRTKVTPQSA